MLDFTFQQAKRAFFDSERVQRSVDRAERRTMIRGLAFIRTVWRRSLRRRKKVSQPGATPSIHSSDPVATLKAVFFAYDERKHEGVVGMIKLNGAKSMSEPVGTTVPGVLEHGGAIIVPEESFDGETWFPVRRNKRRGSRTKTRKRRRRVRIEARPSGAPALKTANDDGAILDQWMGAVGQ